VEKETYYYRLLFEIVIAELMKFVMKELPYEM